MNRNPHGEHLGRKQSAPRPIESRERFRHDHDKILEHDLHGNEISYRARAEYENAINFDDDRIWRNAPSGDLNYEVQYRTDGEEHNYRGPVAPNRIGEYPRNPARRNFSGIGPKGYKRSDERILEDVCEVLTKDKYIDASQIVVEVKDGVVKFSGTVDDRADRVAAELSAENVLGVEDIQNDIKLKKRNLL